MLSSPIGFPPNVTAGLVNVRVNVSTNRPVEGFITVRKFPNVFPTMPAAGERSAELDFLDTGPSANDDIWNRRHAQVAGSTDLNEKTAPPP